MTVLRLLAENPAGLYGLELVSRSEGVIKRGSVYFILDRLQQAGYVAVRAENPPPGYGGKPRHIFTTQALGQEVLDHECRFAALRDGKTVMA